LASGQGPATVDQVTTTLLMPEVLSEMEKVDKIQGAMQTDRTQAIIAIETARRYSESQAQRVEPKPVGESTGRVVEEDSPGPTAPQGKDNGRHAPRISRTYAQFEVDSETHEVSVRIVDMETGEIIRTIPPDELARLVSDHDVYRGLLLEWKL